MKHLKRFNESVEPTKRLSVEEIEDYFLEFIDNKSMEFYYSGIPISMGPNKEIHTTFKLRVRDITTIEELTNFTNLINQIGDVVKRWNLDFKFSTIAIGNKPGGGGPQQTQLTIIQPIPKVIIDNFYTQNGNDATPFHRVNLDGFEVRYTRHIEADNNLDFIMIVEVQSHSGGSGEHGKWLKSDYKKFRDNESNFIKHFTTGNIPSEFISKKESSDRRYGQPFYRNWYFKLLV
jgi:hypothetical protein